MNLTSVLKATLIACTASIILAPACFGGTVIFDNLANIEIQAVGFGAIPVPGIFQYIAEGFTVPAGVDYELTSIDLPVSVGSGYPNQVNQVAVFVMTDVGGLPGNVLESFQLSNLPGTNTAALTTVTSGLRPVLTNGSQYWIAVTGGAPSTFGGWNLTATTGIDAYRQITNGVDGGWLGPLSVHPSPTLGLRVTGEPVPEPGSALFLAGGLIVLGGLKFKNRIGG